MSFKYYRFYLTQPVDAEISLTDKIRQAHRNLGLVRASFDLNNDVKSIGILCVSEGNEEQGRAEWVQFLSAVNIPISEQFDYEAERCEHDEKHCSHDHGHDHGHDHSHHAGSRGLKGALIITTPALGSVPGR